MDEAFDILGCPYQEKMDIYRVSALCMQLGRMEFQGMGEVASPKNIDAAPAINGICQVSLIAAFLLSSFPPSVQRQRRAHLRLLHQSQIQGNLYL